MNNAISLRACHAHLRELRQKHPKLKNGVYGLARHLVSLTYPIYVAKGEYLLLTSHKSLSTELGVTPRTIYNHLTVLGITDIIAEKYRVQRGIILLINPEIFGSDRKKVPNSVSIKEFDKIKIRCEYNQFLENVFQAIQDELYPNEKINWKGKDHIIRYLFEKFFANSGKEPEDTYYLIRKKIDYAKKWFEAKPYAIMPSLYTYFSDGNTGIRFIRLFDFDKKVVLSDNKQCLMNSIFKEARQFRSGELNVSKKEIIENHSVLIREFGDEGLRKWFLKTCVKIYSTWEGGDK